MSHSGPDKVSLIHKTHPILRRGANLSFPVAAACWVDLLGYGEMIAKGAYCPTKQSAVRATKRLRQFHEAVASKSMRHFPTLVMNDGAVVYRDLSFRNKSVTFDFLNRCWDLFLTIQKYDRGNPGARMVIAAGFRVRGRRSGLDATAGQFKSLLDRYKNGYLDANQALHEAVRIKPVFDVIPQLQANYAFTKAYVAEQGGSRSGLGGPRCYVDRIFFEDTLPSWMEVDREIDWKNERLKLQATFLQIRSVNHPTNVHAGVRDALTIATRLTGDPNILRQLRTAER